MPWRYVRNGVHILLRFSVFAAILVSKTRVAGSVSRAAATRYVNDLENFKFSIERCVQSRRNRMNARFFCSMTIALCCSINILCCWKGTSDRDECVFINRISNNNSVFLGVTHVRRTTHPHNAIGLCSCPAHAEHKKTRIALTFCVLNDEWFEWCVVSFQQFSLLQAFCFVCFCRQKRLIFNPFFSMLMHSIPFIDVLYMNELEL